MQKPENNLKCFYLQLTLNAMPKPFCMAQSARNPQAGGYFSHRQAIWHCLSAVTKLRTKWQESTETLRKLHCASNLHGSDERLCFFMQT
ncbi:MAG: hypothetical protein KBI18_05915 [Brachymonas sp.]|nr:hypothetical protein [Brachymonas sp.]